MGRATGSSRKLLGRAPLPIVLSLLAAHEIAEALERNGCRYDLYYFQEGRRYYIAAAPDVNLTYLVGGIPELWRGSRGWRIDLIHAPLPEAPPQAVAATSPTTVPDTKRTTAQATDASSIPVDDVERDDTPAASQPALANAIQSDGAEAASTSPAIATESKNDAAPVAAISPASAQVAHNYAPKDTLNDTAQPATTPPIPSTGPQIDAPKLNPKPAWQTPGNASSMTDIKTPSKDRDWQMQYPTLGESMAMRNQQKRAQRNAGDRNDTPTSERAPLEDETASHAECAEESEPGSADDLRQEEEDRIGELGSASLDNQSAVTVMQQPTIANDREPEEMEPAETLESAHVDDKPAGQAEQAEQHSSTPASDSEHMAEDAIGELQSLLRTEADSPAGRTEIASSLPASDPEAEATKPPSFSGKGYVKVDFEEHQGSKASKRAQRAEKKEEKRRRHQAAQRD
ncbi:hypothetical protein CB0940_05090 [Cercospora beticola]|uniref:Uncharacterized protein n=1 Tax=Cercospora beticola TaxID=122368 RepID=A0A2G5HKL2_CERBT|nr:hypothetical protein CB0940_05090 [Cercospora beticola]PIA93107.1 hypothetical protein CB0940_05090 [Cercospora beticola]